MLYWQLFWSFIKYSFHFVSKYSLPYPRFPLRHGTRIRVVISALMRCFPQPVGPVSCFNQMYSSQGISRIVNIKLIQNVSQKNTKGRNNLGSFLHENSMKWLLDLFVLTLKSQCQYCGSYYIFTYEDSACLTILSKDSSFEIRFFVRTQPISQTNTSHRQIDSWLQLFLHASVAIAISLLHYWLPTSSTNCCSIYNLNKSQSRFSYRPSN